MVRRRILPVICGGVFWLALAPEALEERLIEGMDRGIKGDYEGAIAVFSELIEKFPQYDEAYFNRAIAWEKLQQWGRAFQDYDQALLHNPQLAEAYHQRGLLWLQWGDPGQAQRDFSRAEELYRQQGNVAGLASLLPHLPPAAQSSP